MINDEFHQAIEILFLDNSTEMVDGGGGHVPHFDFVITNKVQKARDITIRNDALQVRHHNPVLKVQ